MNRQLTALRTGIFSVIILLFMTPALKAQSIQSVSPLSGPVGSSITISGTGFSTVAAQNIVNVGGVRAAVTAASTNSLTVIVPPGAAPVNITVTVGGLTAYSRNPFVVTFDGDTTGFKQKHFEMSQDFYTKHFGTADINNDGKQDLVLLNGQPGFSIALNTSTPGQVSFGNELKFETGKIFGLTAAADVDGDGKIDLVLTDSATNAYSVLRNTTNGATVSFAPSITYVVSAKGRGNFINIADLDADGRPEIVTNDASTFQLSIFKNQSSSGNISFAQALNLDVPGFADALRIADMDGDGKPDLVPHTRTYFYQFPVFINSSTPGAFSFATSGYPIYAISIHIT